MDLTACGRKYGGAVFQQVNEVFGEQQFARGIYRYRQGKSLHGFGREILVKDGVIQEIRI